jgi:nitroreductase
MTDRAKKTTHGRRAFLKGTTGLVVLAGAGGVWRAKETGVFSSGQGPAYAPWHNWRTERLSGAMALIQAGILAANAHNTQPWRFHVEGQRIALYADDKRHLGTFDPFRREMMLSLGCALENMVQAAASQGLKPRIELTPGRLDAGTAVPPDRPIAIVRLERGEPATDSTFHDAIARRRTHRGEYDRARPISAELQAEMLDQIRGDQNARLLLFDRDDQPETTQALGSLMVEATEQIISDREMASDSAAWFRFDPDAIRRHRDGVTLDAVGLSPVRNVLAKLAPPMSPSEADRIWLTRTRDVHVATAPMMGLITVRDPYDQPSALTAGRVWQRLHLWATARGIAAHPLNMPMERVDREKQLGQAPDTAHQLRPFIGEDGRHATFGFRLGYANFPARLSPRRSVDSVLLEA